ncbi:MAG: PAS domain S-box protein, partial [Sphingomonadales bacterium]|nr:PAS domain S-box protein [Sphingomonadales bacterium]
MTANSAASVNDDLLWLYELALSIGQQLDPNATARDFLRILVARRNLTGGAIWWRDPGVPELALLDAFPRALGVAPLLPCDHPALQVCAQGVPSILYPGAPDYDGMACGNADMPETYALCPLGDDGILMMCSTSPDVFSQRMIGSLRAVLGKLATAIRGGRSHARLLASETALAEQRRLLRTLVQTLPDLVWLKDTHGAYVTCNARFESFLGLPESEIVGLTDYAFVTRDLAEFFRANDRRAVEHGGWRNDEWLTFADGHRELVDTIKTPMYDDDGNLIGVLGIAHDVTDSRSLQLRLAEERDRSQRYLDTVEAIIVSLDVEGRITMINRKGCDVLGYNASELIGRSWFECCLPQPAGTQEVFPLFRRLMAGSVAGAERFENPILTRTGEERLIEWRNSLLRNELGEIVGTLSAGEDITEYRRAEVELEGYRNHLEALVEERTAALSVAKEAAEAASRAKSAFLANMSHELRTPMNAIMGMTYIALKRTEDPRVREPLGKLDRAARHLLAVINDILDLSRIEAERLTLARVPFDLRRLVDEIVEMVSYRVVEKGLSLVIDVADDVTARPLLGDPLHLKQILLNLLGNAVKFTDQGSISVCVRNCDEPTENVSLRFEICDTGIGISPGDVVRLFDAFEQADGSQTRKYGGTGLGLAISKRLVQLMGGRLGVESRPGEGSVFWFEVRLLPVTVAQ